MINRHQRFTIQLESVWVWNKLLTFEGNTSMKEPNGLFGAIFVPLADWCWSGWAMALGCCLSDPQAITHYAGWLVIETWQISRFSLFLTSNALLKWFYITFCQRTATKNWVSVRVCERACKLCACESISMGMTNLAASAPLLSSLAWSFNPHICKAKHRSASTHPHWILTQGI